MDKEGVGWQDHYFQKRGHRGSGFYVFCAGSNDYGNLDYAGRAYEGQVEEHFANYVNGSKPATVIVPVKCPHCGKEWELEAVPQKGKLDHYSIECPDCKKPWAEKLPGEIVSGPKARKG